MNPPNTTNISYFTNTATTIEIVLLIIIVIIQIKISIKEKLKITNLNSIFKQKLVIVNGYIAKTKLKESIDLNSDLIYDTENEGYNKKMIRISLVKTNSNNSVINRIGKTLNTYLINNYGAAVNFSIIKDIIDREIEVEDEAISQAISTPLYLGLAATMIGIIIGLWSIPDLKGESFLSGIDGLINGVKYAMIASFTGLLCTTTLTSFFYKKAKYKVLAEKNEQLSYLQANLLPELVRAEDTGVAGLKASLERFAREATNITDNVKEAALCSEKTVEKQLEVIEKVGEINMSKVSSINLRLFTSLENNMATFDKFSDYLALMSNISNNLLQFSSKTNQIESIAEEIKSTLSESKELSKFLTEHFQLIQSAGNSALQAVNISDVHFKEAIEKLGIEVEKRVSFLNTASNNVEINLKDTFENIGKKLDDITQDHLEKLANAYNHAIPHFEQLDNLNLLPELKDATTNQAKNLIEAVYTLNTSLGSFVKQIDNNILIEKLDTIEKSLKQQRTRTSKKANKPIKKNSFFRRLSMLFRHQNIKSDYNEEE